MIYSLQLLIVHGIVPNIEARLFDDRPGEEVLELGFGNGHTFPLG